MNRQARSFYILIGASILMLIYVCTLFTYSSSSSTAPYLNLKSTKCQNFFTKLNPPVKLMILDIDAVKNCDLPTGKILAAIEKNLLNEKLLKKAEEHFEILPIVDHNEDFIEIDHHGVKRLLRRFGVFEIGNFILPMNVENFQKHWQYSRKIDCLGLKLNRSSRDRKRTIKLSEIATIANIRDSLYSMNTRPVLFGGSLLGWYRECTIIPHTTDFDLALLSTEFSEKIADYFRQDEKVKKPVVLNRILGLVNESYEVTLATNYGYLVDIFSIYNDTTQGNVSYVSGIAGNTLEKYQYLYPRIDQLCSAVLLGRQFFVPCNVEGVIRADYGPEWRKDHPSSDYTWNKSGKNIRKAGKYKKEMSNIVVQYFKKAKN